MYLLPEKEQAFRELISSSTGEHFSFSSSMTERAPIRGLRIHRERLPIGRKASGAHAHSHREECVYVLKGTVVAHEGTEQLTITAGDFAAFPCGLSASHFIENRGSMDAEFLVIATNPSKDAVSFDGRHWLPPVLYSDRLTLRPLQLSDATSIFEYAQNPNVSRYTLWEPHQSLADSEAYIRSYAWPNYAIDVPEPWAITLKEQPEKVIGTIGCFWVSERAKSMELAYALHEKHWGQGLVAEAAQIVIPFCFEYYKLQRIQAQCKAENLASKRVMEKSGMTYEGTLRKSLFHRDRHWDMVQCAIVR
jgi:ribosomal-protein-alanine N-acetyltransferase